MSTMRAFVSAPTKSAKVSNIAIPEPKEGEILVKVSTVAQNPTDWKAMRAVPEGRIIGCDFAGTVADANGSSFGKGQRIAGFVHGTWGDPVRGSFAEYLITESDVVYAIPDEISDVDASAIPLAFATAVQAMIQRLGLPEPSRPTTTTTDVVPVMINGGTTSVGKYAIQLGKLAGLFVIASGSKRNHALLKDLGADACVDYHDADWPEQVRALTHDKLEHAFDCISENGTTKQVSACLSSKRGGHIVTLLPVPKDLETTKNVKIESTIVYTVFARELKYGAFDNCGAPRPEDKALWVKYLSLLPDLLTSKKIRPNRVKLMDGGLDGIMTGFDLQIAAKVSAEKLVYTIA